MAVRLGWRVCWDALMHVILCKFFHGFRYSALEQPVVKALIPNSKIQVRLEQVVLRHWSCMLDKITSFYLIATTLQAAGEWGCGGLSSTRH